MDQVPRRFFFAGSCGEYFCGGSTCRLGLVSSVFIAFMRPIGGPIAVAAVLVVRFSEGLGAAEGCERLVG